MSAQVDDFYKVTRRPPYAVSDESHALHRTLAVADLHADSLLTGRDLLVRHAAGHVDVPRLAAGGVALQAFTIVTKVPRGANNESNDARAPEDPRFLALIKAWPRRAQKNLAERALFQAQRFNEMARSSDGSLTVVASRAELKRFLDRRAKDPSLVAGILGVEGAHALEGRLANLDRFAAAGIRMISPTHFFDNEIAGSAHGRLKGGLTGLGKKWVAKMEEMKLLIDLAHASDETFEDVLALATRPLVVSHTGVRATCDNRRNLTDAQLRAVAGTGGVVGIGFWSAAVCGKNPRAIVRAIRHAVDVAGIDHVGLGSDFDGVIEEPFDASGLPLITEAMLQAGFDRGAIAKVMGGNTLRLLHEVLP